MKLKLLMMFSLLWSIQTSGSAEALSHDGENSFQVKPKLDVNVPLGGDTELQCIDQTNEGLISWWQTPFGSTRDLKLGPIGPNGDPIQRLNGNVKIRQATASHSGIYQCHLLDNGGKTTTIIQFRVNVVNESSHEMKRRMRMKRVAENAAFSEAHFNAAVSSSVLVTFIVAFTLGAFSQPYVIKRLQRTRNRLCVDKLPPKITQDETEPDTKLPHLKMFYRKGLGSEDTADFSESSIESPDNRSNLDQDGPPGVEPEIGDKSCREAADESDKQMHVGDQEQEAGIIHKQPKRVSKVIKLYNYDEEGNPYSPMTESAAAPTPRQRVMSLTRLQNIMNQAEYPDFSSETG